MLFSLFSFFLAFFLHVLIARPVLRRNGRRFGGTLCGRDEYKKKIERGSVPGVLVI